MRDRQHNRLVFGAAAVLAGLAWADLAHAQGTRTGGGGRPTRQEPRQPAAQPTQIGEAGSILGRILKYEEASDADDPTVVGMLTVRPFEKGVQTLQLRVKEKDGFKLTLGERDFEVYGFGDLLQKGLFCTVNWQTEAGESSRKKEKDLGGVNFDAVEVVGKITKVEGDMVTVMVWPRNGTWPHMQAQYAGRTQQATYSKLARPMKITLKIFENVGKFTNLEQEEIQPYDLTEDQPIEASVVPGSKIGFVTRLALISEEAYKEAVKARAEAAKQNTVITPKQPRDKKGGKGVSTDG